jgi:molybdopterin converting factor small subunit
MVTIHIPTAFRTFSNGRESVRVELPGGGSLRRVIDLLEAECPGIKGPLMFEGGVHPSIAVFVNDEQTSQGIIEHVPEDAEIRLLPAMGGGQPDLQTSEQIGERHGSFDG